MSILPRTPLGRACLAAGLLLIAAWGAASVRRLEAPGRRYVIDSPLPGMAPRLPAPGRHFVPRFLGRAADYPAGPAELRVDLAGDRAAASREGARLEVEVALSYAIPEDRLLDLHRSRGPAYEIWLSGAVREETEKRLREVSYDAVRDRDPDLGRSVQAAVASRAGAEGIEIRALRIVQLAAAGETSEAILRVDRAPVDRRVVVIGVDSFDWRLIDPLVRQGRMPNMARLLARGARFNLRTIVPVLSPVVWTSVATGVKPSRHGIADFVVTARDTGALLPVTSAMRQVPAIWSLLSRQGIESAVVAWWATWPAETIRGQIVTDRVAFQLFEQQVNEDWKSDDPAKTRGKTWPPDLFAAIRPFIRAPADIADAEVGWFLPGGRLPPRAALDDEQRGMLDQFRTVIAAGETYHAIARRLFGAPGPRLKMVYYEGPDTASHLFMRYRPPLLPGVRPADRDLFGGIVDRYYERQDRFIGEIVDQAGPDAVIVLASDHGFKAEANRPIDTDPRIGKGAAADWHTPVGVLLLAGPDIARGADLGSASVLDVVPTILALYGLPAARDMDGQPLIQAIDPAFLERRPVAWVDTYGGYRPPPQEADLGPGEGDTEIVEKLRNLGYIGEERLTARNNRGVMALDEGDIDGAISDFEKALEAGGPGASMIRANLARAWLGKGDLDRAAALARQILASEPGSKQAESILGAIEMKRGNPEAAEAHLRRALEADPAFIQARSQLARLFAQRGRDEEALAEYRKVIDIAPLSPAEHNAIGNIHRRRGDAARAEAAYREALRSDAQSIGACNNLGLVLQEKGRLDEAKALYEKALAIRPENPILRNSLGTLLSLKGDRDGALAEIDRAIKADPGWAVAQGNRATLLFEAGRLPEAREAFERWVGLEPESVEPRLGLALTLLMLQRKDEAIREFKEVLKKDPENLRAHIALGETLLRQGDLPGAQDHLEAAARQGGDIARVYASLGDVYMQRGLKSDAARAFRKSLAIDPKQSAVRERLAGLGG